MIIRDCMKKNVYSIPATASVREAIALLVSRHIGLLPVLDSAHKPIGVVGLRDLLNLAMPSTLHLVDDIDFIGDFGALETYRPSDHVVSQAISTLMRPPTVVREDCGLIRAYTIMLQHDLHDIPVVDDSSRLTGIASRVDIGVTILSGWT